MMDSATELMGGYTAYANPEAVLNDAAELDKAVPIATVTFTPTLSICTLTLNCF